MDDSSSPPPPSPVVPTTTTTTRAAASSLVTAWLALLVAILAMSTGGIWFALLDTTPAGLRASWRLLVTALFLLPGFVLQWRRADAPLRKRLRGALPLLLATGAALAVHFVAWSWSVAHTSLTHSLLFVSTTPLLLVGWFAIRHALSMTRACGGGRRLRPGQDAEGDAVSLASSSPSPPPSPSASPTLTDRLRRVFDPASSPAPTRLEVAGSILGFIGACVLILSAEAEKTSAAGGASPPSSSSSAATVESAVSVEGDLVATVGALAMALYLAVGGSVRKWLPLFLYTFPVTAASAVVSGLISLAFEEGVSFAGLGPASLFGFLGDGRRLGLVVAAAGCSGILGHTLANFSLQHINPLIVSVAGLWEPLLGSVLGWMAGVQAVPGVATLVAGPVLILGAVATTLGARDSGFKAKCGEGACGRWWWPPEPDSAPSPSASGEGGEGGDADGDRAVPIELVLPTVNGDGKETKGESAADWS